MSKKITGYIRLQVPAGKASADEAIGPALRHHGVDVTEFCKAFNEKTGAMDMKGKVPVLITVYADGSFTLKTLMPKAAEHAAARVKAGKFVSAKTGRTVKSLPVEPQLGTERIQKVVRSVVRRNERPERVSH